MNRTEFRYCLWQIHKGNINALEPIYTEYYEKLVISAKRILNNATAAEDAASEAILRVVEYAQKYKCPKIDSPGSYLYRTVKNVALDMCNRGKMFDPLDVISEETAAESTDGLNRLLVERALNTLDAIDAEITEMFYLYDYKVNEISKALSMPEGTVKWKLSEIRKDFKKFFEKF